MKILGMISGTSVDGIDLALVDLAGDLVSDRRQANQIKLNLIAAHTYPYPPALRMEILQVCASAPRSLSQLDQLDRAIARVFAEAAHTLIQQTEITPDLIASHGQTLFHQPPTPDQLGTSWQMGRGELIADHTGITTISNFRAADLALGGEGAPLVPMLDWLLFTDHNCDRCIQNIGGISNLTYLPAKAPPERVIGFDNGPGNLLIDLAAQRFFAQAYDPDGWFAAQGQIDQSLVQSWLQEPFLHLLPPKSTGRELFTSAYFDHLVESAPHLSPHDLLACLTEFTAQAIALSYEKFLPQLPDQVLICGGGSRNLYLKARLEALLAPAQVFTTEPFGIDPDFKEAIAFAVLGYLRMQNLPGNLPSVTGAKHPTLLGEIHPIIPTTDKASKI
ncbi:MAG: anhydro-N-acetylmuramic acid kinase [Pseudanabaenaceae cyanobacterium bins.68]|nr:anhydro-N-acetylmuramic acid kinase [Pseudanabaenaceae cyanobacterium bins.68]